MATIPVVEVSSVRIGALGLTLGGQADPGGGRDPGGVVVPIVSLKMADERQWCEIVVDFVQLSQVGDFQACAAYGVGGKCRRAGGNTLCAFLEGESSQVWAKAAHWWHVPGVGIVHEGLWDHYGIGRSE